MYANNYLAHACSVVPWMGCGSFESKRSRGPEHQGGMEYQYILKQGPAIAMMDEQLQRKSKSIKKK